MCSSVTSPRPPHRPPGPAGLVSTPTPPPCPPGHTESANLFPLSLAIASHILSVTTNAPCPKMPFPCGYVCNDPTIYLSCVTCVLMSPYPSLSHICITTHVPESTCPYSSYGVPVSINAFSLLLPMPNPRLYFILVSSVSIHVKLSHARR